MKKSTLLKFIALFLFLTSNISLFSQVSFTVGPNQGCGPLVVTFTNTSTDPSAYSYQWYFGDGSAVFTDTMPTTFTHTYVNPGYYSAYVNVNNSSGGYVGFYYGGNIQVNGGSINAVDSACVGDVIGLCANGSSLSSASWNFGDPASGANNTSNQNCPQHSFGTAGTYTLTLVSTGPCGTTTSTKTIYVGAGVYPHPYASANPNSSCPGQPVSFNGGNYNAYSWNFGDPASGAGNTSTLANPPHNYSTTGTYNATLTVVNGCGNSGSASTAVNIVSHPAFPNQSWFRLDNSGPVCPNSDLGFNAPGGYTSYVWNAGDGSPVVTNTQNHLNHTYGATITSYNASVTITDACGDDTTLYSTVQVGSNVGFPNQSWFSLGASPNPVCQGDAVNINAPSGYSNYAWTFGDGNTSSSSSSYMDHPYAANGTYTIGVTITNNCGNDTTIYTSIVVNNTGSFPSGLQIQASPVTSCPNDLIDFNVNPKGFQSYTWNFGDGTVVTSSGERIQHAYTAVGTYNVTCVVTNGCGSSTTLSGSITITGSAPVNLGIGVDGVQNPSCPNDAVFFTVHGGQPTYTYVWNYGDGSPADTTIGSGGSHVFGVAGTYNVTALVTNGCGATSTISTTEVISNTAMPVLVGSEGRTWGFAGSDGGGGSVVSAGCAGDAIVFYFEGTAASNQFNFGDGNTGTAVESFLVYGGDGSIPVTIIKHAFSATGNYLVTLTLINGCGNAVTDTMTIHIGGGLSVVGDMTTTPPPFSTCAPVGLLAFGGSDYDWNFGDGNTLSTSSSSVSHTYATAGVYVVSVLVTNGCGNTATFSRSLNVTGVGGPAITLSSSVTPTCVNGGNGSATISVNSGQPPYTYAWNDPSAQTGATATGLPAGLYYATVTDNIGCATTLAVSINNPAPIVPNITTTTTACGASTGTATVAVGSGGTGPYTYLWSTGITNATATGLATGAYSVTVTDAHGCSSSATASISENGGATVALNTVTNATCYGSATGAIDINVTGGTPPYTYMWSNTSSLQDPSALTAGTYSVTVIDNSGCHATLNATISQPTPIVVATAVVAPPTCGNFDGKATVSQVNGGSGPYTYMWDSNAGNQATATATGLPAGTYTVTVTDSRGCTMDGTIDLSNSNAPNITAVVNNVSCYNGNNGAVDISVTGGTSPYLYTWSVPPPQTNHQDINTLTPGNYLVFVNDAHGCMSFRSYTITQPSQLTATVTNTGATCGNTDGTATATPVGGNTSFSYAWTGGQSTQTATGLAIGNYTVTVTDNKGCTATGSASIAAMTLPVEICMVTVDTSSTYNIIYWEKPSVTNIDSFRVYREDVTNVYTHIGSVAYDDLSEYHDMGTDPNTTTKRYKISAIDNCGGESAKSNYHNTIYIVDNGSGQFTWNPLYTIENGANPVDNYILMRDDNNTGVWNQEAITSGTQNTLVDPSYSSFPNGKWYVETAWGITCTPTRATVNTTRSNIKHAALVVSGIKENADLSAVMLYPNPATDEVTLELPALTENVTIKIMSSIGQLVYDQNFAPAINAKTLRQINTGNLAKGIYTISIESGNARVFKKLVIN